MVMQLIQCTTVASFHMGKHTIITKITMISNFKQEAQFAYEYIFLCLVLKATFNKTLGHICNFKYRSNSLDCVH